VADGRLNDVECEITVVFAAYHWRDPFVINAFIVGSRLKVVEFNELGLNE
jgi:hypothetical protein